jgi:hypothetical protein
MGIEFCVLPSASSKKWEERYVQREWENIRKKEKKETNFETRKLWEVIKSLDEIETMTAKQKEHGGKLKKKDVKRINYVITCAINGIIGVLSKSPYLG